MTETSAPPVGEALWPGDTGTLREPSRRALAGLVTGPYVSADRQPQLWRALLGDETAIRARLADLFLTLVVDAEAGVAFVRNSETDTVEAPRVVRTMPLTFMDTVLLLHLRRELVRGAGTGRVIVGRDEVYEQAHVYRSAASLDESGFTSRINASWRKLEQYGILARTSTEGRFEVSPVLRLVFGADEIAAVRAEYRRLLAGADAEPVEPEDLDDAERVEPEDLDDAEPVDEEVP